MDIQNNKSITEKNIDELNRFLRGELSAVETYRQAIEKLDDEPTVLAVLQSCRASHSKRCRELEHQIRALGGTPDSSSGVWGGFAKLVEGGAKVFGKKAAISVLEEGEDHGLNLYRKDLNELPTTARQLVEQSMLPEQKSTHQALSRLQQQM